jgi:hypothetical protein
MWGEARKDAKKESRSGEAASRSNDDIRAALSVQAVCTPRVGETAGQLKGDSVEASVTGERKDASRRAWVGVGTCRCI